MKIKKAKNTNSKYKNYIIITIILFSLLTSRIAYLQFIKSSFLKEMSYKQLITNRIISTKRGSIYDTSGKPLALSAQVDTVSINPIMIKAENDDETNKLKEKVASAFANIFELKYEDVLKKVNSESTIETIAKKVEEEKIKKLKKWMEENDYSSGINIDSDTKRYYPYNNLASNLIGFCGNDNHGLEGLEYYWDNVLSGTPRENLNIKRCCTRYNS